MKKSMFFFFTIYLILISCNSDDDNYKKQSLIGNWKLIETYGSYGGELPHWSTVSDGYLYEFKSDNSLYSDEYLCEGNYLILQNNKIKMHFDCNESQILATYDIYLDKEFLILTPNPSSCDEGCAEKFEKIN
jgi:hypothetical protein